MSGNTVEHKVCVCVCHNSPEGMEEIWENSDSSRYWSRNLSQCNAFDIQRKGEAKKRTQPIVERIVERMKKWINLRNKNRNEKATQGREMGKEQERQLELTKINTHTQKK